MNRVRSLVCTDYVVTGSTYDVIETLDDGSVYVWVGCGDEYLLYSDEYEEAKEDE